MIFLNLTFPAIHWARWLPVLSLCEQQDLSDCSDVQAKQILCFYNSSIQGKDLASKINSRPPVALAAVRSKAMILFLLLPLFMGVICWSLFCHAILYVLSRKRELVALL